MPVAFEGHHVHWVFRPRFAASDARSRGGPDGLPGKYRVVLTLAKPGYPLNLPGTHASESELEGDSNLYVGKEFGDRNVFFLGTEHQRYKVSLSAKRQGQTWQADLRRSGCQQPHPCEVAGMVPHYANAELPFGETRHTD